MPPLAGLPESGKKADSQDLGASNMSRSLQRVIADLAAAGHDCPVLEMAAETRTALQAAQAVGCAVDQIVKSILFQGESGQLYLFLTAGSRQVDATKAAGLAGEPLTRAGAERIRKVTGFAIGGVAPIGHLTRVPLWMDPSLLAHPTVWAAAGTPRHIFGLAPAALLALTQARAADFTAAGRETSV